MVRTKRSFEEEESDLSAAKFPKVNAIDIKSNVLPLHVASSNGRVDIVKTLLESEGIDVNIKDSNERTALHEATKHGHLDIVKELLKAGANAHMIDHYGDYPLCEILEVKDDHQMQIAFEILKHYKFPIHTAIMEGLYPTVKHLLEIGISPNRPNDEGHTPIHVLARADFDRETMNELIKHGAKVDVVSKDDETPLHIAIRSNNLDAVKQLLKHGARVNYERCHEFNPLHFAVQKNNVPMVKELLKHGANVNALDESGDTPLHFAIMSKLVSVEVVTFLLQNGAKSDIDNEIYETPLILAVRYGKMEKLSKIIDHGADVNSVLTDSNGATILHYACQFEHTAIVKKLLTHGANINAKNDLEITPLMLAIQERQFETAKELLNHGANVNMKDNLNFTALIYAANLSEDLILELLELGADPNVKFLDHSETALPQLHEEGV